MIHGKNLGPLWLPPEGNVLSLGRAEPVILLLRLGVRYQDKARPEKIKIDWTSVQYSHLKILPIGWHRSSLRLSRNHPAPLIQTTSFFTKRPAIHRASYPGNQDKTSLNWATKKKHPSRIKHAIRRGDTSRSFFPYPECFIQLKVHNLPRQVIQILTGHSLLNAHQYHLKNTTTPACKCSFPSESIQHFLIDCPLHAFTRTTLISLCTSELGHWPPPLPTFHKSKKVFNALCTFIIRSKRLSPPPK